MQQRETQLGSRLRVLDGVTVKLRQIEAEEKARQEQERIGRLAAQYRDKVPLVVEAMLRLYEVQAEADAIFFQLPYLDNPNASAFRSSCARVSVGNYIDNPQDVLDRWLEAVCHVGYAKFVPADHPGRRSYENRQKYK